MYHQSGQLGMLSSSCNGRWLMANSISLWLLSRRSSDLQRYDYSHKIKITLLSCFTQWKVANGAIQFHLVQQSSPLFSNGAGEVTLFVICITPYLIQILKVPACIILSKLFWSPLMSHAPVNISPGSWGLEGISLISYKLYWIGVLYY